MNRTPDEVLSVFLERSREVIEKPSLREKLTAIAEAVVAAGLFRRVAVQLYQDQYGEKLFGWAGLSKEEERWLADHDTLSPHEYERIREFGTNLGNIFYLSHEHLPFVFDDPDEFLLDSRIVWPGCGYWHPDDMLYAPLQASSGKILGNLTADEPYDGRIPTEATAALMAPFLAMASLLVEQELDRRRDPLTTCFNGPFFHHEVAQMIEAGVLSGLFFLDMDNLKTTNDHQGHAAGDQLIQTTAQELQTMVFDVLGRLGKVFRLHGDEFVVTVRSGAPPIAVLTDQMRSHRDRRLSHLSLGGATYHPPEPLRELLARAEAEMYRDKAQRKRKKEAAR